MRFLEYIKQKQIDELTKGLDYKGIISGFILNFRRTNKVYFLPVEYFNKFLLETTKSSINENDVIQCGPIEVIGEIKRTRYKYYIGEFVKKIQEQLKN